MLEKTLESPLDQKEIQPVHPKGDQSWVFIGRTDIEAGTPVLWPPDVKNWLNGKDPDAGKDWRWEENDRGWDGWMASPTQWTWVWVNSRSWWWTGKPGVLQPMGLQRVRHDWAAELNWLCSVSYSGVIYFYSHFEWKLQREKNQLLTNTNSFVTASGKGWSCDRHAGDAKGNGRTHNLSRAMDINTAFIC